MREISQAGSKSLSSYITKNEKVFIIACSRYVIVALLLL